MKPDIELMKRIACTDEEKKALIPTIKVLIKLSMKARISGVLCLEDDISSISQTLLKIGVKLIIDGTDPDIIKKILKNNINAGNYYGKELLERLIIHEGLFSIFSGENPLLLFEVLKSFLGEEYITLQLSEVVNKNDLESYNESLYYQQILGVISQLIEQIIMEIDSLSLQKILCPLDSCDVQNIIKMTSPATKAKILSKIGLKEAQIILDKEKMIGDFSEKNIVHSQKTLLKKLTTLIEQREATIKPELYEQIKNVLSNLGFF